MFRNQVSDTRFQNASDVIFCGHASDLQYECGSPPGVMMADTLSFNAKIGVVDF